jgi:hypothetical protein
MERFRKRDSEPSGFEFHKILGNSRMPAQLVSSRVALSPT